MIVEFILIFVIYAVILYAAHYVTEVRQLPAWLQFPPFHCFKCLTFWSLVWAYVAIGLSFELPTLFAGGLALAALTAASMHYNQKNKTVSLKDLEDD